MHSGQTLWLKSTSVFAWKYVYLERDPSKWDYSTPAMQ